VPVKKDLLVERDGQGKKERVYDEKLLVIESIDST
jgi:hypothetical protein